MIDVPPTVWPSRVTRTSAVKREAQRTNCAEARACSPFLFGMTTSAKWRPERGSISVSRSLFTLVSREDLARDADIFASGFLRLGDSLIEPAFAPHARELHQHRQIDAGDHLDVLVIHGRDGEVRGRAAEHVGKHHDTPAAVDALERCQHVASPLVEIVVGAD